MSGHNGPIGCCDAECAGINHCRIGGYQCERCGRWYCGGDLDDNGLCVNCAPAEEEEDLA